MFDVMMINDDGDGDGGDGDGGDVSRSPQMQMFANLKYS
tara:strand:+ start:899 stop:1015 length:117 start_codon:yes stop_codon:yes gene_type:complete